jgi:hypothetical protein
MIGVPCWWSEDWYPQAEWFSRVSPLGSPLEGHP